MRNTNYRAIFVFRLYKLYVSIFLLLLACTHTQAQLMIEGKLLSQSDKKPVAYANIGILNTPVGTISNEDGSFSVAVPEKYLKDTLLFSALGFERKSYLVASLSKKNNEIHLTEKITDLSQVTVYSKSAKRKTFELGNKHWKAGNIYMDSISAGSAMALLIENKYPSFQADLTFPVYLEKARLRIHRNTLNEFKIRVRLLEVDSLTALPGKDLLNESILVSSAIKTGWLEFDLAAYQIQLNKAPFFLVFEWILDDKARLAILDQYKAFRALHPEQVSVDTMVVDGEKITFNSWHGFFYGTSFSVSYEPFSLQHYKSYYRNNSYGEWKRCASVLTARIDVSNQFPEITKTKSKSEVRKK